MKSLLGEPRRDFFSLTYVSKGRNRERAKRTTNGNKGLYGCDGNKN